jgi:hypothetical protein
MEGVSLLEILIWVTLSAQVLPREKLAQIMLPILKSPTNLKPKQHVIEIIYGRGKFVGDFNMERGKFVGDFNMGRGKFVGDFNMDTL